MVNEAVVEELAALLGWTERFDPELTWDEVDAALGYRLPGDFKLLMSRFPSGSFCTRFSVYSPVESRTALARFSQKQQMILGMYRDIRAKSSERVSYPLYPESGGVLPWGTSDESYLFFRTIPDDDPDRWPSMFVYLDSSDWSDSEYPGTTSEFMLGMLSGRLPDFFEPDPEELGFYPFKEEYEPPPYYPAHFLPVEEYEL